MIVLNQRYYLLLLMLLKARRHSTSGQRLRLAERGAGLALAALTGIGAVQEAGGSGQIVALPEELGAVERGHAAALAGGPAKQRLPEGEPVVGSLLQALVAARPPVAASEAGGTAAAGQLPRLAGVTWGRRKRRTQGGSAEGSRNGLLLDAEQRRRRGLQGDSEGCALANNGSRLDLVELGRAKGAALLLALEVARPTHWRDDGYLRALGGQAAVVWVLAQHLRSCRLLADSDLLPLLLVELLLSNTSSFSLIFLCFIV